MKEFLNTLYNSLFEMPRDKRNKTLMELFGWDGDNAYRFLQDARLKNYEE